MQSAAMIIRLKGELEVLRLEKEYLKESLQGRIDSLMEVVVGQKKAKDDADKAMTLRGIWRTLLCPSSDCNDEGGHENDKDKIIDGDNDENNDALERRVVVDQEACATALTWLSAICAREVMNTKGMLEKEGEIESHIDSNSIDMRTIFDKVQGINDKIESDLDKLERENEHLRSLIQEKSTSAALAVHDVQHMRREYEACLERQQELTMCAEMEAEDWRTRCVNIEEGTTRMGEECMDMRAQLSGSVVDLMVQRGETAIFRDRCQEMVASLHRLDASLVASGATSADKGSEIHPIPSPSYHEPTRSHVELSLERNPQTFTQRREPGNMSGDDSDADLVFSTWQNEGGYSSATTQGTEDAMRPTAGLSIADLADAAFDDAQLHVQHQNLDIDGLVQKMKTDRDTPGDGKVMSSIASDVSPIASNEFTSPDSHHSPSKTTSKETPIEITNTYTLKHDNKTPATRRKKLQASISAKKKNLASASQSRVAPELMTTKHLSPREKLAMDKAVARIRNATPRTTALAVSQHMTPNSEYKRKPRFPGSRSSSKNHAVTKRASVAKEVREALVTIQSLDENILHVDDFLDSGRKPPNTIDSVNTSGIAGFATDADTTGDDVRYVQIMNQAAVLGI